MLQKGSQAGMKQLCGLPNQMIIFLILILLEFRRNIQIRGILKEKRRGELSCNPNGKNPSDVWDIPNVKNNHIEKTEHPCQFPVGLVERLVLSMTNEHDIVLDPFMGSGSSAVASLKHHRRSVGAEIEEKYIEIAKQRIRMTLEGSIKVREMNKPIYNPNK